MNVFVKNVSRYNATEGLSIFGASVLQDQLGLVQSAEFWRDSCYGFLSIRGLLNVKLQVDRLLHQ